MSSTDVNSTDVNSNDDQDLPAVLVGYSPRGVDAADWDRVRPVVAEALAACDDTDVAQRARYALTRMALHLVDLGHVPTCKLLFDEAMVAHWTATLGSRHAAATHRSTLRRLGRLHGAARNPSRPISQPDPVTERYSHEQVLQLLAHADALPSPATRLAARGLVLAGVGAGLDGYDLIDLPATNVHRRGGLVVADVTGSRQPRVVAVRHEWADQLLEVAEAQQARSPGCVLLGGKGCKNVVNRTTRLFDGWGGERVTAQALRTTWLATHITAGTPMHVLFDQAGVLSATSHIEALIVELGEQMDQGELLEVSAGDRPW